MFKNIFKISIAFESYTKQLDDAARKNDFVAIKKLQNYLNNFPWKQLDKPRPNLSLTGKIDSQTQKVLDEIIDIGQDLNEPSILKMEEALKSEDYFDAQSHAYVAKRELTNALDQFNKLPKELLDKYPGLRRWTNEEMKQYLRNSPYPGYFPKPWSISRLGKRDFKGNWNCVGPECQSSYYEEFMNWGPPNKKGIATIYDPRLQRNQDKYPELFSQPRMTGTSTKSTWPAVR